jgi:TetR/AcrR family transcriptional regulator, cholesterol catabolism regulator
VVKIGESRPAAAPSTPAQQARRDRIVRAAARLASERDHELVQMHEVAAEAGVALATLYRYFPTKAQLFVGVMAAEVSGMQVPSPPRSASATARPDERVFEVLVRATRRFVRRPTLATAMIHSSNVARRDAVPEVAEIDDRLHAVLLHAAGVESPTADDGTLVRLVLRLWYGILQTYLNGRSTLAEAEADLSKGCALLLRPMVDRAATPQSD